MRKIAPLEFVNGGGTEALERTGAEAAVTELAAGSGLFAPTDLRRLPSLQARTRGLLRASGGATTRAGARHGARRRIRGFRAPGPDRLPSPALPEGLTLDATEGAGEVQTPLLGPGARALRLGARVYFRHAKAGELCERFDWLHLVDGERIVEVVPTYRGEGRTFLDATGAAR